ncbi:hypothetical protein QBC37DRAFT_205121 [Rhypophila decipiens]|uniref:Uncharacterized protein n=1 Tax=Rhypophila decipiens TaxID=261697 RepID=A0AAN6Y5W5_9PEZI|nr:hypothetical protein QBC37DRAFT_205121 [Rhypophila decipiens]
MHLKRENPKREGSVCPTRPGIGGRGARADAAGQCTRIRKTGRHVLVDLGLDEAFLGMVKFVREGYPFPAPSLPRPQILCSMVRKDIGCHHQDWVLTPERLILAYGTKSGASGAPLWRPTRPIAIVAARFSRLSRSSNGTTQYKPFSCGLDSFGLNTVKIAKELCFVGSTPGFSPFRKQSRFSSRYSVVWLCGSQYEILGQRAAWD